MNEFLIIVYICISFIAISFWESSVEGRKAWDKGKYGWKIKLGKYVLLTRYHFFLFLVTIPLFLLLPLFIYGWDSRLFGVLVSAYFIGIVFEDFFWFVVNPVVKFKEFNPKFVKYYPWLSFSNINIPLYYILDILLAILFWVIFWR